MKRYLTRMGMSLLLGIAFSLARVEGSLPSPIQITLTGGRHPTLSPDGTFMAYELSPGLAVMKLATGEFEIAIQGEAREPDWSRDNGLILYRGGNPYGLWVLTYGLGEYFDPVFLTDEGFDDGAVWGAGGGHHVVAQTSSGPYGDGLVILAYPSGYPNYLSCLEPDQTSCSGEEPTESPDAEWIAFDDGRLEKVSLTGGESVYVTASGQGGSHPSWSPDGNWIAFVKYEQGPEESFSNIWVTDARGSDFGIVQVTEGAYSDDSPTWSPDSNEIYFTTNRSGSDEIWKVAFDPGTVPVRKLTWGRLKARY